MRITSREIEWYDDFKYVYIKDYGITWALTRKELENDK